MPLGKTKHPTRHKEKFDLKNRNQIISEQVNIVKVNLKLFKGIMFQKESNKLKWIITILIVIKLVDLFTFIK